MLLQRPWEFPVLKHPPAGNFLATCWTLERSRCAVRKVLALGQIMYGKRMVYGRCFSGLTLLRLEVSQQRLLFASLGSRLGAPTSPDMTMKRWTLRRQPPWSRACARD